MDRKRLLIVDANPIFLRHLRIFLTGGGYEVRTATDARSALAIMPIFQPQLILLEIDIPILDGLSLSRKLKQESVILGLVIIGVSSMEVTSGTDKALDSG